MCGTLLLDDPPVTIAAFDAFLAGQADHRPWELIDGRIVGMTNPTERHEQIVANIGVPLRQAIGPRGCQVYFGGIRVQRSDDPRGTGKPRPDLLARCGTVSALTYVTDPLVVVEVLSPTTIDVDRGGKLRFYKALPTLTHIVLVYQDQLRVEHDRRTDAGWELEVLTRADDALVLEALACELPMPVIYEGVTTGG